MLFKYESKAIIDAEFIENGEYTLCLYENKLSIRSAAEAIRPYQNICTSAMDFSINDEFVCYNKTIKDRQIEDFIDALDSQIPPEHVFGSLTNHKDPMDINEFKNNICHEKKGEEKCIIPI
jgi:hypothetical protein